jgi:Na+-translocating ferredoxin:NAD+ oxidoreductase RnfD subunit
MDDPFPIAASPAVASPRHPARRPALPPATLIHSGVNIGQYYKMYFQGALLPISAGIAIYGWRAAMVILTVVGSAALATAVWSRIGPRGRQLRYSHSLWLATLLAMMLPAHLATLQTDRYSQEATWPLLVTAGVMVVIVLWLVGGLGASRIHPAAIAYLLLAAMFGGVGGMLEPHWVLDRGHVVVGDLLHDGKAGISHITMEEPWIHRHGSKEWDSEYSDPPASALIIYTTGNERPARGFLQMQGLIRDALPPLENLIIGGAPGPIGTASAVAVIIGGLFLLYRGVIDYRVPLIIVAAAFITLLIAPVPAQITDHAQWHWLAFHDRQVGWATAITLANYELVASPLLFIAFFFATSPVVRPMSRRARVVYAAVLGATAAVLQLYLSVSVGPYIALLVASLLTPMLDRIYRPRPLV